MGKTVLRVVVALMVLLGMIWGMAWAADEEMSVPLGDITLQSLAQDAKRADVTFPHALHFGFKCQTCHHKWKGTTPIASCTAAQCHDLAESPKTEEGKPITDPQIKIRYFKNAFHEKCIGCHKKIAKNNKMLEATHLPLDEKLPAVGPTGCNGCHPKE